MVIPCLRRGARETTMRAHTSRFSILKGSLLAGAFFATLLAPWGPSLAAPPVDASIIPRIETAPQARDFFLGDSNSRDKLQALFCEKHDVPRGACPDQLTKPYLRVDIVRGGGKKGANPFPLVAVGTSSGSLDQKSYQLWVFQSQDNPRLVIGFHNSGPSADYVQMSVLPAGKTAMTKDVLEHIDRPDPHWKVADVKVDGDMSRILPGPGEDSRQDERTSAWGIQKVDVGESGGLFTNPIQRAFGSIQDLLNSSIAYLINQYKDLVDSLLTNDYLKFLPYGTAGTAVAASSGAASATAPVIDVWHLTRDLANIFFLIILLAIAFGNVLRLEYYAIRALLPRFIAAVVLVNLSLLIVQVILDAVGVLTAGILGDVRFGDILSGIVETSGAIVGLAGGGLFFGTFLLITIALAVLTVVVLLVARIVMLWFLVAVAPAAFLAAVLPATRDLYTSWWSAFWRFALIAPAMALVLRLASAFSETPAPSETGGALLRTTLIVALLFLAGTIPVMLGGKLMANIQKFMQKRGEGLRKGALARSSGYQAFQNISREHLTRAELRGADVSDAIGTVTRGHLGTTGLHGGLIRSAASKREDNYDSLTIAETQALARNRGVSEIDRLGAWQRLVKMELVNTDSLMESRGYLSGTNWHEVVRGFQKTNITGFMDERLQALLNANRDFVAPKYISDENGTAFEKILMRFSQEDWQNQQWSQLARIPAEYRRHVNLPRMHIRALPMRQYFNLISQQAAHTLYRDYFNNPAWRAEQVRAIERDFGIAAGSPELEIQIENRLITEASRLDPELFATYGPVTQRSVIRELRDPGADPLIRVDAPSGATGSGRPARPYRGPAPVEAEVEEDE